ncbi:hypothetical protein CF68_33300 [Cupriavidus sp. SK-4]|uniref:hypothetical protein n=1 Tax=Cupriavidus sp. SK-4 TaxID=574750 RepID=UPI000447DAA5|nr:hypothetical protein [Cupriavidus sp. SK-4]EYS89490.1 hypothetical protein CF68_33300 [Cupriavidus sp. SK-4]
MSRLALARTAGILGGNVEFRRFLAERYPEVWAQFGALRDTERAAAVVRAVCGIASRSELDSNPAAAQRFHTKLGFPFNAWRPQRPDPERP